MTSPNSRSAEPKLDVENLMTSLSRQMLPHVAKYRLRRFPSGNRVADGLESAYQAPVIKYYIYRNKFVFLKLERSFTTLFKSNWHSVVDQPLLWIAVRKQLALSCESTVSANIFCVGKNTIAIEHFEGKFGCLFSS